MSLPVLYSFRRCPYAMRARFAIAAAGLQVELREVVLKDKPSSLLEISPKGTVPVLQTAECVIEESRDIALWAFQQQDPAGFWQPLSDTARQQTLDLIAETDGEFKNALDRYKYADRYPEHDQQFYRQQGELFLQKLEAILSGQSFLLGDAPTLADIAVMPFIRQFVMVDQNWFNNANNYQQLQRWLNAFLKSAVFKQVMQQYPQWQPGNDIVLFPGD
ncbi:MAG: glutathione S-transferase [Methylophaga sp.]|nr:glutathione S-transferase [Methylophaga sp.]